MLPDREGYLDTKAGRGLTNGYDPDLKSTLIEIIQRRFTDHPRSRAQGKKARNARQVKARKVSALSVSLVHTSPRHQAWTRRASAIIPERVSRRNTGETVVDPARYTTGVQVNMQCAIYCTRVLCGMIICMGVEGSCLFRWTFRERVDLVLICILLVYLFRTRWQPDKQQDNRGDQRRRPIREEDQVRPLGLAEQGE
jgi:hypothetical protein